jgi:translation initiation factor 1A
MVKNTAGGNSHKKFARKHQSGSSSNNNMLRVAQDEGEIYAITMKMLGNKMFHCLCIDGVTRLGHIRGKFEGRGRRDNVVEMGKWILIGLREWDISTDLKSLTAKDKMQKCDLLEVYNDNDKERLKDTVSANWRVLDSNDMSKTSTDMANEAESGFCFATEKEIDRERLIDEMKTGVAEKIKLKTEDVPKDDEINIDDI